MITVLATFALADGHAAAWEEMWQSAAVLRQQQPGLRSARLFRDMNQPGRYVLHSEWDGREHVDHFVRTSGLPWLLRGLDLCAEHPAVAYLDAVGEAIELP